MSVNVIKNRRNAPNRNYQPWQMDELIDSRENCPCQFEIRPGEICGGPVKYKHLIYCSEHLNLKCHCGAVAVRYCNETDNCKHPLCKNNKYCEANHFEKVHMKNCSCGFIK